MVYAVGLPDYPLPIDPVGPIGGSNPMGWLWLAIPIELHILLAGFRARTALDFLVVALIAASFMGIMIWSVYYAPWLHDPPG